MFLLLALALGVAAPGAQSCLKKTDVGAHIVSIHIPQDGQNNFNPGLWAEACNVRVGALYNSRKAITTYAAYRLPLGSSFSVFGGVQYGVSRRKGILPLAGISYQYKALELSAFPTFGQLKDTQVVFHLTVRFGSIRR